jgi:hypothetical protein
MASITFRSNIKQSVGSTQEQGLEESFRYVNFLLMWYRNRSSMNLANTIVAELEKIERKMKGCEDSARNEECQRLIMRAMKLFSETKGFKIKWNKSPYTSRTVQ